MDEELRLATLCINYLNLPSFMAPYPEQAVRDGEYGFMEYAILYWLRHLEAGLASSRSGQEELREDLAESLEILVEQHWNKPTADVTIPNRTRKMLETFRRCDEYQKIQLAIVLTDKELKHFGGVHPEQRALDFAGIVPAIRLHLETIIGNNPNQGTADDLKLKYGTHLFRCPRFSCYYFTEGFSTLHEREKHIERHERPARCTDEHCRGSKIGFATEAQLERHLRENHPDIAERHHNFPTEEEISESVRANHPEPETEPAPEPELQPYPQALVMAETAVGPAPATTTIAPAAAAVAAIAPTENAQEAALQPIRPYKRSKTKQMQIYECAHCGRSFNKKFNWQSHLASHGDDKKYSCPDCGKTCARSGDLVRHMKLHDPDNAVTCGGVLSNGQRWGCGKRFARADTLRQHHESKKGRQCIAARDNEEPAGPSSS